jgi:sigma-B regulation protein RsbU (phosphoserine phosphatase)
MTIDGDESLGILVADASGHGVGSALLAAETRAYLRALAMTCPDVDRMLWLVNQRISDDPEYEGFVTAFLLRLAPRHGAVAYANAGHCPAIVFDGRGEVRRKLDGTGIPLGIDPTIGFSAEIESLEPGELILLYSDGATEACSPTEELFGVSRLLETVRTHWAKSANQILEAVFRETIGFYEGRALRDDITVVVIKRQ